MARIEDARLSDGDSGIGGLGGHAGSAAPAAWLVPAVDLTLPDISDVNTVLVPVDDGAAAARLAADLIRHDFASANAWIQPFMGKWGSHTPRSFLEKTVEDWISPASWADVGRTLRASRIARHLALRVTLARSFWDGVPEATAVGGAYLAIHCTRRGVWRLREPLDRLAEADPPLANFVYYALVDSVAKVVPVYDWRTASREYRADYAASMAQVAAARGLQVMPTFANNAGALGMDGDPMWYVPSAYRKRRRFKPGQVEEMIGAVRDPWAKRTAEAARHLDEAAAKVRRADLDDFPAEAVAAHAELVDASPVFIAAFDEMDPTEGAGREAWTQWNARTPALRGPAPRVQRPGSCLRIDPSRPKSLRVMRVRFEQVCVILDRAAALLAHLERWERRKRNAPEPVEARVMVTV
jgi:hypothetical protein